VIAAAGLFVTSACSDSTSPSTGSLSVAISAVSGTAGSVTVTGPNGYSKTLTATTTLTGLQTGSYTVTGAPAVQAGPIVGTDSSVATVTGSPATVARNQTASVTVTYGLSPLTGGLWIGNDAAGYSMSLVEFGASQLTSTGSPTPVANIDVSNGYVLAVAFDRQGNMWALSRNNTIVEYTAAQQDSATPTPVIALSIQDASNVSSLAFDSAGDLWMPDPGPCNFYEYKAATLAGLSGSVTTAPDVAIDNGCNGVEGNPISIAFDKNWNMWVGDNGFSYGTQEIYEFPADSLVASFSGNNAVAVINTVQQIGYLAFDSTGNLWATGEDSALMKYSVAQLAASGSVTAPATLLSLGHAASLVGLAFDNGGNLWVADQVQSFVYEVSTAQLGSSGVVSTPAVVLSPTANSLYAPYSVAFEPHASGLPLFAKVPKVPRISAAKRALTKLVPR
jgi:hypothetical protein